LIADEPTTALDVTIQAQIIELLSTLRQQLGMAVIFITHNLGLVAETADRVAVMYAGQVVESCLVRRAFTQPLHPYTAGLQASMPRLGARAERLRAIAGVVPNPADFPRGCRFHPRCPVAHDRCREEPELREVEPRHFTRCFRAEEIATNVLNPLNSLNP
jgi:oligopeptide/dipeptide ABC transporter ATP-binding protein